VTPRSTTNATRTRRKPMIGRLSEEALLDLRLCDLGVSLKKTWIERCIERLYEEMERKGICHFLPHCWLSSEWFSPDGVPGIAVPFYLTHPALMKLEKKMILQVEGGTESECMRILRHETGHCIDTAYRLHRRKRWRELFGSFTEPYPDFYSPRPGSRKYVLHLSYWYSQAHPAEDFAETFAVWLNPNSRWRQQYKGWPAMRKLEYVDALMKEIGPTKPAVRSRKHIEPLSELKTTLRKHYRDKRRRYLDEWPEFYDADLAKLFSDAPRYAKNPSAAGFLRHHRTELREIVSQWTGTHPYTIDQVLRDMIDRCKELKLRLTRSSRETRTQAMIMVTVQTMNYIHSGHFRVAL